MPLTKQKNAPGRISTMADCWSADTTKVGFLGMTVHWIQVTDDGKWKMRSEAVALKALSGDHGGENLGRYFISLCERVGIVSKSGSKVRSQVSINKQSTQHSHAQLYAVTLDNTSSNNMLCQTIERLHTKRGLTWSAEENQLPWVFINFFRIDNLLIQ